MLVQKSTIANGDVISIKADNGSEIIGKLHNIETRGLNGKAYTIHRPLQLILQDIGNGQGGLRFLPFMLGLDENGKIVIDEQKMMVEPVKARPDLAKQYLQATSSLDLPMNTLVT